MTCTLSKTLENLDKKIKDLQKNINSCKEEARECLAEMNEVKRLIKGLKAGQSKAHSTPR